MAIGAAAFTLDLIACQLRGTDSLLGIVYKKGNAWALFLLWSIGAALMGLIGGYVEIFQLNRASVLAVGLAWPILLSKLVQKGGKAIDDSSENEEMEQ